MRKVKNVVVLSSLALIGGLLVGPMALADNSDATVKIIDKRAGGEVKFTGFTQTNIEFQDLVVDGSKTEDTSLEKMLGKAKITISDTRTNQAGLKPYEVKLKAEDNQTAGMFANKMEITLKPTSTETGNGVSQLTNIKLTEADKAGGVLFTLPYVDGSVQDKVVVLNPELKVTDTSVLKDQSYGSVLTWTLSPEP